MYYWDCGEAEIKLNTPEESDAVIHVWVDGNQVLEKTGFKMRAGGGEFINKILFGGWYSNSAKRENPNPNPAVPSSRYVDDVIISTERVGCLPDVADKTAPRPPTGVQIIGQ